MFNDRFRCSRLLCCILWSFRPLLPRSPPMFRFIFIWGFRLFVKVFICGPGCGTLFGRRVLLLRFPLWLILFSVDELNLTIIVLFIFDLVTFIAAALMLFRAVMPADVWPCAEPAPWMESMYWFEAFWFPLLLVLICWWRDMFYIWLSYYFLLLNVSFVLLFS